MTKRFKIRGEDSHAKWDKKEYPENCHSGRNCPVGYEEKYKENWRLVDKIIYKIDKCPHCKSKKTYHSWIMHHKSFIDNVWRSERKESTTGKLLVKFDYCLECQKEFLIELYLWEKINEPTTT